MSRRLVVSRPAPIAPVDADGRESNVLAILADQARARTGWELAATAAGGALDAAFVYARLDQWWVSAVFIAIGAYGSWGLLDLAMERLARRAAERPGWMHVQRLLDVGRGLATAAGVLAALAAIGGFMAVEIFRGWIH